MSQNRFDFTTTDYWKVYAYCRLTMGKMVRTHHERFTIKLTRGKFICNLAGRNKEIAIVDQDGIKYWLNKNADGSLYAKSRDGSIIDLSDFNINQILSQVTIRWKIPQAAMEQILYPAMQMQDDFVNDQLFIS